MVALAGDHKQLPVFKLSDEAKRLWPKSFLKDCVEKGVPFTQLAVQYRMHEVLADDMGFGQRPPNSLHL